MPVYKNYCSVIVNIWFLTAPRYACLIFQNCIGEFKLMILHKIPKTVNSPLYFHLNFGKIVDNISSTEDHFGNPKTCRIIQPLFMISFCIVTFCGKHCTLSSSHLLNLNALPCLLLTQREFMLSGRRTCIATGDS